MTDLLTTAQAADLLGVSTATVDRWFYAGRLPEALKAPGIRGARWFNRADVEALRDEEKAA